MVVESEGNTKNDGIYKDKVYSIGYFENGHANTSKIKNNRSKYEKKIFIFSGNIVVLFHFIF
jgi:hypothetical protein